MLKSMKEQQLEFQFNASPSPSSQEDPTQRESVRVLIECIELQCRKSQDYQNPRSRIQQAEYYPNGILTLLDIVHAKKLRMESVMSAMLNDPNYSGPGFESIEDSAKDMINYCSFIVSYCRGRMDGQVDGRDCFNREVNR